MTHVLHLTTWHPCIDGVSGTFVLEQCAALRAVGAQVGLIFSRMNGLRGLKQNGLGRGLPGFVKSDIPVPTLGFKSWAIPGVRGLTTSINNRVLENRYKAYVSAFGHPDVLHAHVALGAGYSTLKIASRTGCEYVVTEHSSEILNGLLNPDQIEIARAVYSDARRVLAVSTPLAERIVDICPSAKVKIVGNLVRNTVFELRSLRTHSEFVIKIISIGGLFTHKRVHNTIAALEKVPKEFKSQIEYHVIGDGPERRRLEEIAHASGIVTKFHGNVPHDKAMRILSCADLLVHASAYETFGVVLAEAMALGIPVVATRCGGPEYLVNEDVGALVSVDDVDGLADAIRRILAELPAWKMKADEISKFAYGRFHEAVVSKAIMETY